MKIIKRDGHIVDYIPEKIEIAINKANVEVPEEDRVTDIQIKNIIKYIESLNKKRMLVEDIQDIIEIRLMALGKYKLAKAYITYRYTRELVRRSNTTDLSIKELINGENEFWNTEYSSRNAKLVTTQRDYLAGITSNDITRRFLLPEDIVKAHDEGIIHFHDTDYFAQNALHNSSLINLEDMLQNGTNVNGINIIKPHRFLTAMTIATQLINVVSTSEFGGCTISLTHLAPFVKSSYEYYLNKYKKRKLKEEDAITFAKEDLKKEVNDGVQTFLYQINTMASSGEPPYLSVFMYLGETKEYKEELAMMIEEFFKQRIEGMKNENGEIVNPEYPKYIYVLEDDNVNINSKYYYLTKLASECTLLRSTPDYISEKVMKQTMINSNGEGDCYPTIGFISLLSPDRTIELGNIAKAKNYKPNKGKYYGRFNQGAVSINLPDVALSCGKDEDLFWKIFDERLELCHKALQIRHKRLSKVTSDVAPTLWQFGALARLEKGESIHELLHHGYSTISLGYAGLYECVKYMTGRSFSDSERSMKFAVDIMNHMNEMCNTWTNNEDSDYLLYATPLESTTYKFAKCLRDRFGKIKGITDREYITNSYLLPSFEDIDSMERLKIENEISKLSLGGSACYLELQKDEEFDDEKIKYLFDNVLYTKVKIKEENKALSDF
jgi:ribonucleoside-triphosphate reductase